MSYFPPKHPLNHLDKSWWLQAPVDWCERHAPSQQKQLKPQKATRATKTGAGHGIHPNSLIF